MVLKESIGELGELSCNSTAASLSPCSQSLQVSELECRGEKVSDLCEMRYGEEEEELEESSCLPVEEATEWEIQKGIEIIEQHLPPEVVARAQERAYFISCNTGSQDHVGNYYEALEIEMEILGAYVSDRVLVRDEEVFEAMKNGLCPELAARASVRAYYIWEETRQEDSAMNYFVAVKEELRAMKEEFLNNTW